MSILGSVNRCFNMNKYTIHFLRCRSKVRQAFVRADLDGTTPYDCSMRLL